MFNLFDDNASEEFFKSFYKLKQKADQYDYLKTLLDYTEKMTGKDAVLITLEFKKDKNSIYMTVGDVIKQMVVKEWKSLGDKNEKA